MLRSASVEVVEYERPLDAKYEAEVVENVPSLPTQDPFIEKHPAAMLKPLDAVVEPVLLMENSDVVALAVDDEIWKSVVSVSPLFAAMPNLLVGDVVPMPMVPEVGSLNVVVVAGSVPKIRLPMLSWLFAVDDAKNVFAPRPMFPPPVVILPPVTELLPTIVLS